MVDNPDRDQTSAANSARISTSLRQSVEQLFSMKNVWKILKGRINQAFFRPLGEQLCRHYTAKHPSLSVDQNEDWYDISLIYVIFADACSLVNWFGAGFARASTGPVEERRLAQSLLTRLNIPNVLSDPDLSWGPSVNGVHIAVDPCGFPDVAPPGIHVTRLGDVNGMAAIGIPQVQPGDGRLLLEPGGGGCFCLRRGEGLLSLERGRELRDLADAGHFQSLSEYTNHIVQLPEQTCVQSFRQNDMPRGWSAKCAADANFPVWSGPCTVVTLKLPSHFKNNRLPANMHKVVFLFSDQPTMHNGFTGVMQHFFASWCSCRMGGRTNTLCAHRSGGMVALQAVWFFKHTVTKMFKVIDIWRHPNFQPITTGGVPAGNRDRTVLTQAFPCRPRRSLDKRASSNRRFDPSYQPGQASQSRSGHGQRPSCGNQAPSGSSSAPHRPQPRAGAAQDVGHGTRSAINHPSGLAGLLNSNNCCYVNAVVQMLTCITAQDEIDMMNPHLAYNHELLNLYETLYDLCQRRQHPSHPPFSAAPLRDCFNALSRASGNGDKFQVGHCECSLELIQEVLTQVSFTNNFFADFPVVATCHICNQQISETVANNRMLSVALTGGVVSESVPDLFRTRMDARQHFLDFVHCHCVCPPNCPRTLGCSSAVRVQGHLSETPGEVLMISLDRSGVGLGLPANSKVLTPLRDLSHMSGYNLKAVLCHVERTRVRGHWIAFVKKAVAGQPVWWKLDDSRPVTDLNPFLAQCDPTRQSSPTDFTIDILVFKR